MNIFNAQVRALSTPSHRLGARWFGLALVVLSGMALAAPVRAQNTLENVSYQMLPGGKVALSLQFSDQAPKPDTFTTDEPPRIALDFADTVNAVPNRNIDIGAGSTSGATIVTANGRTRVVVDLFRPSSYRIHQKGDTLVVDVANGKVQSGKAQAYAANNPTKAPPATDVAVSGIDFRRDGSGAGKVIVDFNKPGATADLRTEHGKVIVRFSGVSLPDKYAKDLDVNDFATPVRTIETRPVSGGARMTIDTASNVETMAYQSGTKYVVTIKEKAEQDKQQQFNANGTPKKDYSGQRVTFNFQDIPVRQVLHLIASESDFNIVVADDVSGTITLRLVNVPWDHALDIVLRAKGLDKRKSDNVIWVAPQEKIAAREQALAEARMKRKHSAPLVNAFIPISYGKAKDIAELLTTESKQSTSGGQGQGGERQSKGFLSPRGSVSYDGRTNTLLVRDTRDNIQKVRKLVATLDRPVRQVLIQSRIVVATDDFARSLGVRFGISAGYEDKNGNVVTTTGSLDGADSMIGDALENRMNNTGSGLPVGMPSLGDRLNVNLPISDGSPAGSFGLAILGADYLLDLELSAAQTEGKSEIISSPRVITANQQPAMISQGQQIGYQTVTSAGGGGGQLPQVQFKDVTLKLQVTPTITADGRVFLDLDVNKDSLAGFYNAASGQIPIIDTRQIQTSVLVDNGATVVLGGILEVNKTTSVTKVPFLGDLPILGALFRTRQKSNSHAELLVFVTPRIIQKKLD